MSNLSQAGLALRGRRLHVKARKMGNSSTRWSCHPLQILHQVLEILFSVASSSMFQRFRALPFASTPVDALGTRGDDLFGQEGIPIRPALLLASALPMRLRSRALS